jgi:[ribosomal protein S5]-alanine N-acetyltransferase
VTTLLTGDRIYLRHYTSEDAQELTDFQIRNRDFFSPYFAGRQDSFYTLEQQQKDIESFKEAKEQDRRYTFGIYLKDSGGMIGEISLFDIKRGNLQKAIVGYCMDHGHTGKGYMNEALQLVIGYSFGELGLHRLEAGAMPMNTGSLRTLRRNGFQEEGTARSYLHINGQWHDHVMFALLAEDIAK